MTEIGNRRGILLVVSGAAGTGKGTVNSLLIRNHPDEYAFSVSATTRAPRAGEIDGVHYHFIPKDSFEELIGNGGLIEYTSYCGNCYGTPKTELSKLEGGKNLILEIETEGAMNIKRMYPDCVTVFILPPDYDTLYRRLKGRGTNTEDDIRSRMNKALAEFRLSGQYDYIVINADGEAEAAAEAINNIIRSERHKASRNPGAIAEMFPESVAETNEEVK